MNWLQERSTQRTEGAAWREPASVVACDEMWTYRGVRSGSKRESWWIWTAVVEETDGRRWVDFEVGDRSANTFERWYARLPEAQQYCSDVISSSSGGGCTRRGFRRTAIRLARAAR